MSGSQARQCIVQPCLVKWRQVYCALDEIRILIDDCFCYIGVNLPYILIFKAVSLQQQAKTIDIDEQVSEYESATSIYM